MLQCCCKSVEERVAVALGYAKGWEDTEYISASSTCEDVLFVEQAVANFLVGMIKLDANH